MAERCTLCAAGARGETGHAALREHFRSGVQGDGNAACVLFACTACGSYWMRRGQARAYSWQLKELAQPVR